MSPTFYSYSFCITAGKYLKHCFCEFFIVCDSDAAFKRRFNKILYNQKNSDLAFQMGQEINLIGICAEAWDKLNPLLKQAKEAMIVNGMNPEDFY